MKTKEYIISALKKNKPKFMLLGVTSIGLFGSYIRNEQTPKSDIDILIDFVSPEVLFEDY